METVGLHPRRNLRFHIHLEIFCVLLCVNTSVIDWVVIQPCTKHVSILVVLGVGFSSVYMACHLSQYLLDGVMFWYRTRGRPRFARWNDCVSYARVMNLGNWWLERWCSWIKSAVLVVWGQSYGWTGWWQLGRQTGVTVLLNKYVLLWWRRR